MYKGNTRDLRLSGTEAFSITALRYFTRRDDTTLTSLRRSKKQLTGFLLQFGGRTFYFRFDNYGVMQCRRRPHKKDASPKNGAPVCPCELPCRPHSIDVRVTSKKNSFRDGQRETERERKHSLLCTRQRYTPWGRGRAIVGGEKREDERI